MYVRFVRFVFVFVCLCVCVFVFVFDRSVFDVGYSKFFKIWTFSFF